MGRRKTQVSVWDIYVHSSSSKGEDSKDEINRR